MLPTKEISADNKQPLPDISSFRMSLEAFLQDSHPELTDDDFIAARADAAADCFEQAVRSGETLIAAEEQAGTVFYEGLHFSKKDTILYVLWNEFAHRIPQEDAQQWARHLLPVCTPVFDSYGLSDDFAYGSSYSALYTELTGTIAIYLEDHYGI